MAMSQGAVMFVGAIAMLATAGLFVDWDDETGVLVGFLASILWGAMAMSSFSVHSQAWSGTKPMPPLVYIGIAMALLVALLTLYQVAQLLGNKSGATESRGLGQ